VTLTPASPQVLLTKHLVGKRCVELAGQLKFADLDLFVGLMCKVWVSRPAEEGGYAGGWLDNRPVREVGDRGQGDVGLAKASQHRLRGTNQWTLGIDTHRWVISEQPQRTVEAGDTSAGLVNDRFKLSE